MRQEEIDALLEEAKAAAAMAAAPASDPAPVPAPGPDATPAEAVPEAAHDATPAPRIRDYDFRRPDEFNKEHLRTLQAIHENAARNLSGYLATKLRSTPKVTCSSVEPMLYEEFLTRFGLPTQLVVCQGSDHLGGSFLMQMELGFLYACIDRILGGPGRVPTKPKQPTPIEAQLIRRILDEFPPALDEAWSQLAKLDIRIAETALTPALLRVAAPSHAVAVVTFEVNLGGHIEAVNICYPQSTLAPLLPRLSVSAWYADTSRRLARDWSDEIDASLLSTEVELVAEYGRVSLTAAEVAALEVGSFLVLETRAGEPLTLRLQDVASAQVRPGLIHDQKAVALVTPLTLEED